MNEAAVVAVGLAAVEGFSSIEKVIPEGIHEATPEAENGLVESGKPLNVEPQQEHEDDVIATNVEDTHPDIHSSLHNDSTPVPLPLEAGHMETELVTERQVETTSTVTTKSIPIDLEDQPNPSSKETAPNTQKDTEEVQTQVDDSSNIKDELTPESDVSQDVEAADTEIEGPLKDVPASSVKLESDVDIVAPAKEESSTIAQGAEEDLSLNIEGEGAISRTPGETIPIPEDATASVANFEDQIIASDFQPEHAAAVEISSTDKPGEVILPRNVEESRETLTPLVEPSYMSSDEIVSVSVPPICNATLSLKNFKDACRS